MKLISVLGSVYFTLFIIHCGKGAPEKPSNQFVAAAGGLTMRASPDTGGQFILVIPNNSQVTVTETIGNEVEIGGRRGRWVKVKFNSQQGYVFGGFLSVEPASVDLSNGPGYMQANADCDVVDAEAWLIFFEPEFKVRMVSDKDRNFDKPNKTQTGTYKTNADGTMVTITWTNREEQDPKRSTQMQETEKFLKCECSGKSALCSERGDPYIHTL